MNEIYQAVAEVTVSGECVKMTKGQDYKKIVRMIDVMSKGNPQ